VPRLWTETIEAHRRAVRDATLDAAAALVSEHGLRAVTMSQIAEATGIGRATLYKYFPDVDAIVTAWHERQIAGHLEQLARIRDQTDDPAERLRSVLAAFAFIQHRTGAHDDPALASILHRGEEVSRAEQHVRTMFRDLLADTARSGSVRTDVDPDELAAFCLHALAGARTLSSAAAVERLVALTLAGLRAST
jgi:AcrR family transcriptional regulator